MTSTIKTPLTTDTDLELEALKDNAATQRALDYYLKPAVSQLLTDQKLFHVRDGVRQEDAMAHASELLRCTLASAQGSVESLQGSQRDLVLSLMYSMEMTKMCVDKAIDTLHLPAH